MNWLNSFNKGTGLLVLANELAEQFEQEKNQE